MPKVTFNYKSPRCRAVFVFVFAFVFIIVFVWLCDTYLLGRNCSRTLTFFFFFFFVTFSLSPLRQTRRCSLLFLYSALSRSRWSCCWTVVVVVLVVAAASTACCCLFLFRVTFTVFFCISCFLKFVFLFFCF